MLQRQRTTFWVSSIYDTWKVELLGYDDMKREGKRCNTDWRIREIRSFTVHCNSISVIVTQQPGNVDPEGIVALFRSFRLSSSWRACICVRFLVSVAYEECICIWKLLCMYSSLHVSRSFLYLEETCKRLLPTNFSMMRNKFDLLAKTIR